MGGTIGMDPNKEGGSVFHFTVPLERSSPYRDTRPVKTIRGDKMRTLIVDDSPEARRILASYTRDIGLGDIVTAASGETALAIMKGAASRENPYDLCFIDMIMPVMDGWRLASTIHNDPQISHAKLILMVPHGLLSADTKMTLLKWFVAYINKPIKRRELAETIHAALVELTAETIRPGESAGTDIPQKTEDKPLILMAEDHPVNRQLFSLILDKLGYPVVQASDGIEALEKIEQNPVSLIFMDIQMPLMNGYEAVEVLRRRGYKQPVIAVTASTLAEEREQCLEAGFNDVLTKPFKRSDLEQMLVKWGKVIDAAASINGAEKKTPSFFNENKSMPGKNQAPPVKRGLLARTGSLITAKEKTMPKQMPPACAPGKAGTGLLSKMNVIKEQNASFKAREARKSEAFSKLRTFSNEETFNPADLLDTFMDNTDMVKSLLGRFLGRTKEQVESMEKLLTTEAWEELRHEAHTIKASSLTLSGKELGESAAALELAARNRDAPKIQAAYSLLKETFPRFEQAVSRFLER
jgi:CheY-like chemotaxis protein/HPt (histidine-containing phosphotransfer) domain-containing protein